MLQNQIQLIKLHEGLDSTSVKKYSEEKKLNLVPKITRLHMTM